MPTPNTTVDIYNGLNALGIAVPCHLTAEFEMATQHFHGSDPTFRWTHIMYLQWQVPIYDTWPAAPSNDCYIPQTLDGCQYLIVFVESVNKNQANQYQRVYLQRQTPPWPTATGI